MKSPALFVSGRVARTNIVATCAFGLLSACTAGPDFEEPSKPASLHYDQSAENQLAAADGVPGIQRISVGRKVDGDWWSAFASAKLDDVMHRAIEGNLDLAAADATIAQASEAVRAAEGARYPQVDYGAQIGRQRAAGSPQPTTSSLYAIGPQVSFDLDVFGGTKRLVERQGALADLQKHRFEAAYLTLTGDVASQAILEASARTQIDAVQVLLADDRKNLELVGKAHLTGSVTRVDVALAESQFSQDQTLLPPLAQQRDAARHALSVLAGEGPADWVAPDFDLADFVLPADLPVSLPSELAHDRPDIQGAEAELHAASAAIGVATADLYPHLTLSASLTQAATGPGSLFEAGSTLWSIGAGLAGPIFHGGTLEADRRAAVDGYQAALANYRQTVVKSLGQVADELQAISHDAEQYAAQERALAAARTSLRLNQEGYRLGETGVLQVLDAERAYQQALLGHIRAETARYLDTTQLAVALGGNSVGTVPQRTARRDEQEDSEL
jgi:NodT family efflux transporter outer membrane factor (OMF) lipoprotein